MWVVMRISLPLSTAIPQEEDSIHSLFLMRLWLLWCVAKGTHKFPLLIKEEGFKSHPITILFCEKYRETLPWSSLFVKRTRQLLSFERKLYSLNCRHPFWHDFHFLLKKKVYHYHSIFSFRKPYPGSDIRHLSNEGYNFKRFHFRISGKIYNSEINVISDL